ncbi:MAG: valine--tRNA ligase [Ignavibacteria bacterium]|nr:valine--tRNA ligase [Ignavibacteria bacterium]
MENPNQEIAKAYNPSGIEDKWYSYWLDNQVFKSVPDSNKKPYSIVIPPPNITGMLTMGHILNNSIQDILIRLKRMQGYNVCWVPGTDHASIATETKVIKFLSDKGIDKFTIGREEFLKHCHEWKQKYGGIIIQQLKKLGVSCDWDRERFTMDEHYYEKVIDAFVELYNEGKIYKGYRLVNWCPVSKSAISDEEVIPRPVNGSLWYMRYPIEDSTDFIIVATTRPETMLGDTGVAVNPNDERYAHLIGKNVILPICNRKIPIFGDEYVDMTFGTGAVKVTPAHDVNDYEMGLRHNLEIINILNEDATLNHNTPEEYHGLDRYEARDKIVARFQENGLLEKIEAYSHNVGFSERGGVPIEPYLSEQWYMKMDELAAPALQAVKDEQIRFYPSHWVKTYEHWMDGIRDWCISRQLWWGHRIPVWYCEDRKTEACKKPLVSKNAPASCPHCGSTNMYQDEDVLDTWASSWLWAHEVFPTKEEQDYYYPTDTLVTAPDIIFFWVARMIMAGLHFKNAIPFKNVYFTSIIRDSQGRKMSKSLGNSPDPLDVIGQYGADALRFTVIYLAPLGQDVMFATEKCEMGRNFANKLWNAGRFLLMNLKETPADPKLADMHIDSLDKWIESRFHNTLRDFNTAIERFELNNALKIVYSFVWNDFCDWYVEFMKVKLYADDKEVRVAALTRASAMFERLLQLVHPFMPFITEELWHLFGERKAGETISKSVFPAFNETKLAPEVEAAIEDLKDKINGIRNIRGEMNLPPSKPLTLFIKSAPMGPDYISYMKKLTRSEQIEVAPDIEKPAKSASVVLKDCEIFVPLEGLIDLDIEKNRLQKEIDRLEGSLIGVQKKLSNESFVQNAPADIVEREKQKLSDWQEKLNKLINLLKNLQ